MRGSGIWASEERKGEFVQMVTGFMRAVSLRKLSIRGISSF